MNNRWKEAVERVDTLDTARQEQVAQVVLDMIDDTEIENLRALLAEANADIAAGRTEAGGAEFWQRRRDEVRKMIAAKA